MWKDIIEYESLYEVSDKGEVRNKKTNRILKPISHNNGYLVVTLYKNKKPKIHSIHRLVAMAFISHDYNNTIVNHKDSNKENNAVGNLEWCTQKDNVHHSIENGTFIFTNPKECRKVYQYDYNNNLVYEFNSVKDVERKLGFKQANISRCCLGNRPTAYGYIWSYIKKEE